MYMICQVDSGSNPNNVEPYTSFPSYIIHLFFVQFQMLAKLKRETFKILWSVNPQEKYILVPQKKQNRIMKKQEQERK